MGQEKKGRRIDSQSAMAKTDQIRTSPQKLGLVVDLVRGKSVDKALNDLRFCKKRVAQVVLKTLQSAIANAENNHYLDIDNLIVDQIWVGKSLLLKRFHARARGRGARICKHYSNLTVIVREKRQDVKKEPKKGAA